MAHAISEAAKAKIVYLSENPDKKEVRTGFHDIKIDSEVYALEKMLGYFQAHEKDRPMHPNIK